MNNKYVIIGAGIAGLEAAKAIRELDKDGIINIFTAENNLPYSRPMLTKCPLTSFDATAWTIYGEDWFKANNINIRVGRPIQSVDSRAMHVSDGEKVYFYDRLILACGGESFIPPIPGGDGPGVFAIRRSEDILNIKRACKPGAKAVIIGGGVIGLEAACQLSGYGASVTVLEAMPYLMMRQIDREISELICKTLTDIDIHTDVKIASIDGNSKVTLDDGRVFPCDFVVMACGIRAETSIVPESVEAPRAISIDDQCRTSDKNIYAAGDCAQHDGTNYALWSQAMVQGRICGFNAAADLLDKQAEHKTLPPFDTSLIITSPELSLFALGDMGKDSDKEYKIKYSTSGSGDERFFVNPSQGQFFEKQYLLDGRLVGAAIVGNLSHMQELKDKINGTEEIK